MWAQTRRRVGDVEIGVDGKGLTHAQLREHVTDKDLRRLELYTKNLVDHHLVTDLLPPLARLYFLARFDVSLSAVGMQSNQLIRMLFQLQQAILLGMGLQHKRIEDLHEEFPDRNVSQLLALNTKCLSQVIADLSDSFNFSSLPPATRSASRPSTSRTRRCGPTRRSPSTRASEPMQPKRRWLASR